MPTSQSCNDGGAQTSNEPTGTGTTASITGGSTTKATGVKASGGFALRLKRSGNQALVNEADLTDLSIYVGMILGVWLFHSLLTL